MRNRNVPPSLLLLLLLAGCGNQDGQATVQKAESWLDQGKLEPATIELKNVLRQDPDNLRARWLLGELYFKQEDYPGAEKELLRAARMGLSPDSWVPMVARSLQKQDKHEELVQLPEEGLSNPAKGLLYAAQGESLLLRDKLDSAKYKIQQAEALNPDANEVLLTKARLALATEDTAGARQLLEKVVSRINDAAAWGLLGNIAADEKRLEDAEQAYGKAMQFARTPWPFAFRRGLVRLDLQRFDDAQADIDLALKAQPNHFEINYARGRLHFHAQRFQEAAEAFSIAVANSNGQFAPAEFYLGASYFMLGDRGQADEHLTRYMEKNPGVVAGRKLLAQIRAEQGRYDEVERLLRPVVDTNPEDTQSLELLAVAVVKLGKHGEGAALYETLAARQEDSAEIQLRLGSALLVSGDVERGMTHLDKAVEMDQGLLPTYYGLLARHYMGRKDPAKAREFIALYREKAPDSAEPSNLLGSLELLLGSREKAAEAFATSQQVDPGNPFANQSLAALAMEAGDFQKAGEYFQNVLDHDANHLDTLMKMAIMAERLGRNDELKSLLEKAVAAHPESVQPRVSLARYYVANRQPEKVSTVLGDTLTRLPLNPGAVEINGRAQLDMKANVDALASFETLVSLVPDSAPARYLLATSYLRLNRKVDAERELRRALDLDAKHFMARVELARAVWLRGDMEAFDEQVAALRRDFPEAAETLSLQGVQAVHQGDTARATDLYKKAFETAPDTKNMLALAQHYWDLGDRETSLSLMRDWVETHPENHLARRALGKAYYGAGKESEAIEQYQKILENGGQDSTTLNNLAWLLRKDNPDRALELIDQAYELAPRSGNVSDTYALIYLERKEFKLAKRKIEQALSRQSDHPTYLYHKALIASEAGDKDEALTTLQALLNRDVAFPEREQALQLLTVLQPGR